MQVIKPFEINDSNMTSTIAEPDVAQGEAEWIQDRPNFFNSVDNNIFGVAVVSDVIYALSGVDLLSRNVQSYQLDGTPISSFSVISNTLLSITTDGTDLFLCATASTTSVNVYRYTVAGVYVETKTFTFFQAATQNDRAICYFGSSIFAHSYAAGYSTVTEFDYATGTRVFECDVSAVDWNPVTGLTTDGSNFYLLNSASKVYIASLDFDSVAFQFYARINGSFAMGMHYYDSKLWLSSSQTIPKRSIGFLFSDGSGAGAYGVGEQAIKTSTHLIYQATTNTTDDPEVGVLKEPSSWEVVSATNKYRAFDFVTNLQSSGPSPLVITLTPFSLFSTLAVFNVTGATSVNITVNDPTEGEVYNKDIDMIDITGIVNMWQYLFYQHVYIDKFVIDDLPPYKAATITVTFTGAGEINVGELVYGKSKVIGRMTTGSSTDRKSYSKITIDSFGNQSRTKAPSAAYTSFNVDLATSLARYVDNTLKEVIDEPALFIGDSVDDQKITSLGYYERSPLVLKTTRSDINIKVRSLV